MNDWKDHHTAQLVNALTETAIKYAGTQQLRERIRALVVAPVTDLRTQLADATRKLEEARKDALGEIRMLVRSDAVASGFQTLGQYRKMLSEEITRAIDQGNGEDDA
jgi:hypothetical protein